mgnify:CR=1 FL=1
MIYKILSKTVKESVKAKQAREALEKLISEAVLKHVQNHTTEYGCSPDYYEVFDQVFDMLVTSGIYNGKTYTFKLPKGTVTFHAEVNAPND